MSDNQIRFHDNNAMAVYTIKPAAQNTLYGYPGDLREEGFLPVIKPFHTLVGDVACEDGNVIFLRRMDFMREVELPQSLKYAMRHDNIFIEIHYGDSRAKHADAVDFKSIQAAGGIVAKEGKIVAIDNVSGHYEPGWGLLSQAVKKIETEGAFHKNAVIGVFNTNTKRPWFFPVDVYLGLAEKEFVLDELMALRNSASGWQLPGGIETEVRDHLEKGMRKDNSEKAIKDFANGLKKIA